ncbi:alpha/beta hydrolase [Paenibacillus sp. B1-33]|uniref:alpha/beta hydrolase n=1 Tax=unclassified Paenibacillus TaxID=185978 RepID=UPI003D2688CC
MKDTRVYKKVNNCSICADIYYQGSNSPVILYIHGGALIFGARSWLSSDQIEFFRQSGFSIVNIDYRLAPETGFEEIIEDIKDAMNWIRTKTIDWYDFDVHNIAVMGSSAGGYLSLLIGTMDIRPKVIVSFYGYGDILGGWLSKPSEHYCQRPIINKERACQHVRDSEITNGQWERFDYYLYCRQQGSWLKEVTGINNEHDDTRLIQYNPIHNITIDFPPTLFLHGDQDTDVPYEQSVLMYKKLKEKGVAAKLITIEGADHVFDQSFCDPQVQSAFEKVIVFLRTHLCK